jgi:phosphopantothenoylcysteine decarboxylase
MLQMISNGRDVHRTQISGYPPPFVAAEHSNDGKAHLLLAASGSVATIKIPNILKALSHHPKLAIRVILTKSASNFLQGQSAEQPHIEALRRIKNVEGVFLDEEEWVHPWKRGNGILHIELRRWAHILVITPLSANTLAKITGGLCDNLLTSVVRAWDTTGELSVVEGPEGDGTVPGQLRGKKIIVVAPAMNTAMWRHPATNRQIKVLEKEWGVCEESSDLHDNEDEGWFEVLRPQEKQLACGDVGDGAMKDWNEIVKVIELRLGLGE